MAEVAKELKRVLVTGGNSGIGLALCKQLLSQKGCFVYLGSRNLERGQKAVDGIRAEFPNLTENIELVQVDISNKESVVSAAKSVKDSLGGNFLYGLVNNAGTGLAHKGVGPDDIINVNYWGTRSMTDNFMELIDAKQGRVIHVASGAGPMWLCKQADDVKAALGKPTDLATLDAYVQTKEAEIIQNKDMFGAYGLSKAALSAYAAVSANATPDVTFSSITPGFIATDIVKGMGATKKPEEGTVSIMKCLFEDLPGNGYYYGSDGLRSPLTATRNPGDPEYNGD